MELKDKVAIVTGGGQGLGEAIVKRLVNEGCKVTIADVNLQGAERVADEINGKKSNAAIAVCVDVTKSGDVEKMARRTQEKFGSIDILVSNAGILKSHSITEFPEDEWRKIIDVNLTGYFLCVREVAKVMMEQKSGVIIQINSKSGKKGSFWNSAYVSSKFGGLGLTQSIALDLAPYGIRVNAICPGNLLDSPLWIDSLYKQYAKKWGITEEEVRKKYTEQVPLGRGCTYEDVCNALVFLASDKASYMTGQAVNVTGGQEMR